MPSIFSPGQELIVLTKGPGILYLLSRADDPDRFETIVGGIPTTREGVTPYLISFSHNYDSFSLVWKGEGEAVYQVGDGLERKPLGREWNSATTGHLGASSVVVEDVSEHVDYAENRGQRVTASIIPTGILSLST